MFGWMLGEVVVCSLMGVYLFDICLCCLFV